ncbi:hypothetical protein Pmani_029595 [Petrolisthes manimaculis]|uniref:Uncharacterized protein n=1 Tax=Petrolisthes manimaculis TaxID=1843537 RepID=A0AAE1TWT5_9EUCA|nr:hypothetical protein Pmani_029595 [Petrolisthes manimaculis]
MYPPHAMPLHLKPPPPPASFHQKHQGVRYCKMTVAAQTRHHQRSPQSRSLVVLSSTTDGHNPTPSSLVPPTLLIELDLRCSPKMHIQSQG